MKRLLQNAALVVASVLIALLVGEGVLRLTGLGSTRHMELFADTVPKHRPHATYWNRKENDNLVRLNNWGFHDYDHEVDSDAYRLLFLGDSMLEGAHVHRDSLFTSHLGRLLARHGADVEVLNAGVSGTGTAYHYVLWQHYFRDRIAYDHVVLCFFLGNDFRNNSPTLGGAPTNHSFYLDDAGIVHQHRRPESPFQALVRRLSDHSHLAYTVYQRAYLLRRSILNARKERAFEERHGAPPPQGAEVTDYDHEAWAEVVAGTLRLLGRWHDELAAEGVPFSVVLIEESNFTNDDVQRHPHKRAFLEEFDRLSAQRGIEVLYLRLDGYRLVDTNSFDGSTIGHFNHLGHRLVARRLFDWFRSSLAPDPSASWAGAAGHKPRR